MEVVGLAVGVVGLAGLFNVCIETIERVQSYKSYDGYSKELEARLDAERLRFKEWGEAVGIKDGKIAEPHHEALDDTDRQKVIEKLLKAIANVCPKEKQLPEAKARVSGSRRERLNWSLLGKARKSDQVQRFTDLIQLLYDTVPPDNGRPAVDVEKIMLDLESLGSSTAHVQKALNDMKQREEKIVRKEIYAWVLGKYSQIPDDVFEQAKKYRLKGTCDWILDRPIFTEWMSDVFASGQAKLLWIHGPAGFGKTVLCAGICEHLALQNVPGAHFFMSSSFEIRDDPFSAVRFWVSQMITTSTAALGIVQNEWEKEKHDEHSITRTTLLRMFKQAATAAPGYTFLLDGLDECVWIQDGRCPEEENSMPSFIQEVMEAIKTTRSRVLIISRDEPGIRIGVENVGLVSIYRITKQDVEEDNGLYSQYIVGEKLSNRSDETKHKISEALADQCGGMFQWVKLQLGELKKWQNEKQLLKSIEKVPSRLEDVYARTWDRIEHLQPDERIKALTLLRWILYAVRPLGVQQIVGAFLLDRDEGVLDVEDMPDVISDEYINEEIIQLCGSFIEVYPREADDPGEKKIRLAHFSVKEFFAKDMPAASIRSLDGADQTTTVFIASNVALAKHCLRYLMVPGVRGFSPRTHPIHAFREHATSAWWRYASLGEEKDSSLLQYILEFTGSDMPYLAAWRDDLIGWGGDDWTGLDKSSFIYWAMDSLSYAAGWGLRRSVTSLLQSQPYQAACKTDLMFQNALRMACCQSHEGIVLALLDQGVPVELPQNASGDMSPLCCAVAVGNSRLINIFLEGGASPQRIISEGRFKGYSALEMATKTRQTEVVKQLLHHELRQGVAWESVKEDSLLAVASFQDDAGTVQLLLDYGMNPNLSQFLSSSPLFWAAYHGNLDVACLLIAHGADLSNPDFEQQPLSGVARQGQLELARLLIEAGASTSACDEWQQTPLHVAAICGHSEVTRLFIEAVASVSACRYFQRTPLHIAAEYGHSEVARLLIESGASVSAYAAFQTTPLHVAAEHGQWEVAQLLIKAGASVAACDLLQTTPLHVAAARNNAKVVKALLQFGADTRANNWCGHTPLMEAAYYANLRCIDYLLKHDPDQITGDDDNVLLLRAVGSTSWKVVSSLFKRGARLSNSQVPQVTLIFLAIALKRSELVNNLTKSGINLSHDHHSTEFLFHAIETEDSGMIESVLRLGADINHALSGSRTPLAVACEIGHVESVRLLLQKGADVRPETPAVCFYLFRAAFGMAKGEVAKLLIDAGLDVLEPQPLKLSPLFWAMKYENDEVFEMLLEEGVDVHVPWLDDTGAHPIHLAVTLRSMKILDTMIDRAVPLNTFEAAGWSPLALALQKGRRKTVKRLLKSDRNLDWRSEVLRAPGQASSCVEFERSLHDGILDTREMLRLHDEHISEGNFLSKVGGKLYSYSASENSSDDSSEDSSENSSENSSDDGALEPAPRRRWSFAGVSDLPPRHCTNVGHPPRYHHTLRLGEVDYDGPKKRHNACLEGVLVPGHC